MKKIIFVAIALIAISAQASDETNPIIAKAKLEKILSCSINAEPPEVLSLIKTLGGLGIVKKLPLSDAEYTIPNPVEVFGRPVTKISIHHGENADGEYNEYGSIFKGETFDTVARIAEVNKDATGLYRKEIKGNDLILRPEAGATYISCANDVRTFMKTIRRNNKTSKLREENEALFRGM